MFDRAGLLEEILSEGGISESPTGSRGPFEVLDDLMQVIESLMNKEVGTGSGYSAASCLRRKGSEKTTIYLVQVAPGQSVFPDRVMLTALRWGTR